MPEEFRKKVYKWCGSGTYILVHYTQAGIQMLKTFEASDFIDSITKTDETLDFLKSVNMEFKNYVQINTSDNDDYNLCCICFATKT